MPSVEFRVSLPIVIASLDDEMPWMVVEATAHGEAHVRDIGQLFEREFNPLVPGLGTVGSPAGGLVAIKSIREPSGFMRRGEFKGREVDRSQTLVLRWIDR